MSKITPEEVRRIAALANIGLQDEEIKPLTADLSRIVGFVEQLQTVDVSDVPPTNQVTGLTGHTRKDVVQPGLSYDDLTLNAPDWQDGHFKVKRVLDND